MNIQYNEMLHYRQIMVPRNQIFETIYRLSSKFCKTQKEDLV